jgi:hypothetical protein
MDKLIAGEPAAAAELAAEDPENTRVWSLTTVPEAAQPGSSAALAAALTAFEADALGQQPDEVVLADDSETALAAALVATKMLIPVSAAPLASTRSCANGRLIAQLASAYTRSA